VTVSILGIESSCDETAAAVVQDGYLLSSVIATQDVHRSYGGVVPELASRAHQQNIVPVVDKALKDAGLKPDQIDGLAFTRGPGLMGALLVGTSFAKGLSLALGKPLIEVNHLQAHILVHFIKEHNKPVHQPDFPFLCLLVSGGHTQLVKINNHLSMEVLGSTLDDAAGEAFDKCAKLMRLPYPGGPVIDRLASEGNPTAFSFSKPRIPGLDFSFSGLKTSFLYLLQEKVKENPSFIEKHLPDLCASLQYTIVDILAEKVVTAAHQSGIHQIALAGGVAANSGLQKKMQALATEFGWELFIPPARFTTDNAAMIAITGYYKFREKMFSGHDTVPVTRSE